MEPELKALFEAQQTAFAQFQAALAQEQAEVKKLGAADAVTSEKLAKLNTELDRLADAMKETKSQQDEIERKVNRAALTGRGGDADPETKTAVAFGRQVKSDFSVDDLRAYKAGLFEAGGYMRRGTAATPDAVKALSVGSDPDGGYLVTPDVTGRIVSKIYETSAIRQYASVITIGTDALEGMIDNGETGFGWVGERESRPETTTPQLGKWTIAVNEMYAQPGATQKVLDDAVIDIESWLIGKVADKFARVENAAFITGDGQLKPKGLFSYNTAATTDATRAWGTFEHIPTGVSASFPTGTNPGALGEDKLLDVVYALKAAYRTGAVWAMPRSVVAQVRKFRDAQARTLWQTATVAGQPSTLLGYPVAEMEDIPAIAAGSLSVAFGNFREAYQIVDRMGISLLRDPYTSKGNVLFYVRKRTGGGAVNYEAMKFLKFSAS